MPKNDKKRKRTKIKQEPEGRSSTRLPWKKRKTSQDTSLISGYRLFRIISMVLYFVSRMFSRQAKHDKLLKRVDATLTRIEERDKMNGNNYRFEAPIGNLQICGDGRNQMDIKREQPAGVSQFCSPKPLYQHPSHPSLLAPVPTGLCHNYLGFQPAQMLPASLPLVPKYTTDTQQETSRKSPAFFFAKPENHNADGRMLPLHMLPAQLTTVPQEQPPERELSGHMQAKTFTGPLTPEPQGQPRSRSMQAHSMLGSFITSHFQPALTSEPHDKRRRNDACTLSEPASGQKADWEGEAKVDPITSAKTDEEEDCFISDTSEKFDTKGSQQKSDMESESLVEADDGEEEIFMPDVKSSMRLGTKAAKERGPLLTLPASFQTSRINKVRPRDASHWTFADDTDPFGLSNPYSDTDFDSGSECEWMDDKFRYDVVMYDPNDHVVEFDDIDEGGLVSGLDEISDQFSKSAFEKSSDETNNQGMKVPHTENVPTSKQQGFGPGVSATNQKGDFRIGLSAHYTDYVRGIQSPVSVTDTECTDGSLSGVLAVGTSEEDSTGSALSPAGTGQAYGIQSGVSAAGTGQAYGIQSGVSAAGTGQAYGIQSGVSAAGTGQAYGIQSGVSPADTGRAHENQSALTAHDTANAGRAPDVESGMSPADTGQAHEVQSDMSPANTARVPENQPVLSAAETASTGRAPDVKSGMSPAGGQAGVVSPGVSVADRVQADGTDSGGCAKDTLPKGGSESCVPVADTGQTDGSLPGANTGLTRLVGFDAETDCGGEGIDSSMPANNTQQGGDKARVVSSGGTHIAQDVDCDSDVSAGDTQQGGDTARVVSAGGTHLAHDVDCDSDVSAGDTSMKGSDTGQTDGTQAAISAIDTDPGGGRESVDDICLAGDEGSAVSASDTGQPLCIDSYSQNLQGSEFGVKVGDISSQKNPTAVDLSEFVTSQNESTGTAVPMSVRSQGTAVPMSVRSQGTAVPMSVRSQGTAVPMSVRSQGTAVPMSVRSQGTAVPMSVRSQGTAVPMSVRSQGTAVPMSVRSQKEKTGADMSPSPTSTRVVHTDKDMSVFTTSQKENAGADNSVFAKIKLKNAGADVSAFGTSQKAGSKANVSAFGTSQKAGSKANVPQRAYVSAFGTSQKAGSKANVPRADGLVVRSESIFYMSIGKGQIHFLEEGTEEKKNVWPKGIDNKVTGAWDWSPEDSESDGVIPLDGGVSEAEEGTGGTFSSAEEPHAIEHGGGVPPATQTLEGMTDSCQFSVQASTDVPSPTTAQVLDPGPTHGQSTVEVNPISDSLIGLGSDTRQLPVVHSVGDLIFKCPTSFPFDFSG